MTNKAHFCVFLLLIRTVLGRQIRSLPTYQVGLWSLPTYQIGPQNPCNPRLINDLRLRKITYEKINLFMQNEPNFRKSQVNLSYLIIRYYVQMDTWSIRKNEPKRTQNEPNFSPKNDPTNPNEPNSKPIQTQFILS